MNSILDMMKKFPSNDSCRVYLEKVRWNNKPCCPRCKHSQNIYIIAPFSYKCSSCLKKFNVLLGTIFENTKLPLQKWFMSIYLATSYKKGISSLQLSRDLEVTQKTAWFMLHRIREMLKVKAPFMLDGQVEVDETYIGGKNINRHACKKVKHTQGRSSIDKTPVLGMIERKGNLVAIKVDNVQTKTLTKKILANVKTSAHLYTDEWIGYQEVGKLYAHSRVNHSQKKYVNGIAHTNTIEGFWSLLKRGIIGIYHFISKKHLDRYLDEFTFRYNTKQLTQKDRFNISLSQCESRIKYKHLIKKAA